jgi:hypothetical protein
LVEIDINRKNVLMTKQKVKNHLINAEFSFLINVLFLIKIQSNVRGTSFN